MGLAIADEPTQDDLTASLFEEIPDPRMMRCAVERAAGSSWKQCAAAVGVDESTIYIWLNRYPIKELAKQIALEGVSQGALKLMSNFSRAVDVITSVMDDETAKPSDRLNAASQIVRNVVKVAQANSNAKPAEGKDPLDDVGDADLVEFIRATRALGPGQGGR